MKSAIRIVAIGVATLTSAGALAACGSSTSSGTGSDDKPGKAGAKVKLAAVFENTGDPFWNTVACGAKAEATRLGADLRVYKSATISTSAMSTNVDSALLTHPDGLILSPFETGQFAAKTRTLMQQGVPVVTFLDFTPSTQYQQVTVSQDGGPFTDAFVEAAGSTGTLAVLSGAAGNPVMVQRVKPLVAAIKKASPGVKVLPLQYTNFDVAKATQTVSSLLVAHPDLKMVLAASGPEGQGAAAAIDQAKKAGKVKLFAYDAVPPEVQALRSGTISALVAQPAAKVGAAQVKTLVDYLEGHPEGGPVTPAGTPSELGLKLITKDNIDDPESKPYLYSATCEG
jgi:ribose transport system substrate-binding protein